MLFPQRYRVAADQLRRHLRQGGVQEDACAIHAAQSRRAWEVQARRFPDFRQTIAPARPPCTPSASVPATAPGHGDEQQCRPDQFRHAGSALSSRRATARWSCAWVRAPGNASSRPSTAAMSVPGRHGQCLQRGLAHARQERGRGCPQQLPTKRPMRTQASQEAHCARRRSRAALASTRSRMPQ